MHKERIIRMKEYVICTDSACDISSELLAEWGVCSRALTFRFDGDEKEYSNSEMPATEFYAKMREGGIAKTAAVNTESFKELFEGIVKDGKDVLYLGFSSGLSTTFNSARIAAIELSESYPDARIITVDTLCASAGQGLLLNLVIEKKNSGADIEEAAKYAAELKPSLCHWFTVDR